MINYIWTDHCHTVYWKKKWSGSSYSVIHEKVFISMKTLNNASAPFKITFFIQNTRNITILGLSTFVFNFLSIFNLKQFLFNISYLGELLFSWIYRKKYQRKKFINQINRRHIGFLGRCMNSIHKSYNMYLTLPTLNIIPYFVQTNYYEVNFIFLWW